MQSVAVLVPIFREGLLPDEEFAVRHLRRHLGRYACCQLSPRSLNFHLDGLQVRQYDDHWFHGVDSYSKLLLSKVFYEGFADYEYILIYQLDCLVFRDKLEWWCNQEFDYLGAPLFNIKGDPGSGFSGACNGGLSLRKVSSFLKVLNSERYLKHSGSLLADIMHQPFLDPCRRSPCRRSRGCSRG